MVTSDRCWPFREAQQAHLRVSFGENSPSNSIHQRQFTTHSRHLELNFLGLFCADPNISNISAGSRSNSAIVTQIAFRIIGLSNHLYSRKSMIKQETEPKRSTLMLYRKSLWQAFSRGALLLTAVSLPCMAGSEIDYDQDGDVDDNDLARASQNPVADMISLPIKNRFNFDRGDEDAFAYELELQPVLPVKLGEWNLINRFIVPLAYQEPAYEGMSYDTGLRNITYQAFFSPAAPSDIIWGVGPTVNMPTNTEDSLGNDKWSGGPAVVALTMRGAWVTGLLAQQFWDFAGDDDAADVELSSLQYFVNYNTPDYYLSTSPTMTYNWEADSDDAWTIPVGGGIGKIFRFDKTPVDVRISAYRNVEAPDSTPDWYAEFQIKFLFPK